MEPRLVGGEGVSHGLVSGGISDLVRVSFIRQALVEGLYASSLTSLCLSLLLSKMGIFQPVPHWGIMKIMFTLGKHLEQCLANSKQLKHLGN